MRFKLTPTNTSFFDMFAQFADTLVRSTGLLSQMLNADHDERVDIAAQIRELEHHADESVHQIMKSLNQTFVTPFDRDDIYRLASALDDCMDFVDEAADLLVLYKIDDLPKKVSKQVNILVQASEVTAEAMPKLRSLADMPDYWVEINRLENQADRAHRALVADLFENEKDPIRILKVKELVDALESAADAFERVANTIETIAVKES